MKILRFDAFTESASSLVPDSFFTQNAILMADSSLRPHRRPLFVPTEGLWLCELRPAVKISLLGKGIAKQFAKRYYAEYTVVNYMVKEPDPEQSFTPGFMLDDALVQGQWQPLPEGEVHFTVNGIKDSAVGKDFSIPRDFIDNAIAALSGHATFKTGDLIVLPQSLARYIPRPDMHVTVCNGDTTILDFKIK